MEEEKNKLKNIFSIEKRTKYFAKVLAAGLCFFSLAIFFLLIIGNNRVQAEKEKGDPAEAPAAFNDISLEGKGVVVWDVVNSRELFSKKCGRTFAFGLTDKSFDRDRGKRKNGWQQKS